MITVRLFGGLGNQLFQYAAGRALALTRCVPLQLDARLAPPGSHWAYGLGHFNIAAAPASEDALPPGKDRKLAYAAWRAAGRSPRLIREKGLGYQPERFEQEGDLYLHGYWQSEKYFKAQEAQLREDLTITTPPGPEDQRFLDLIGNAPAVSLHLRRGDYVASAKSGATHGTCDAAYYDRALQLVAERMSEAPQIFVFSDDAAWARDNLRFPFETHFVGHNGPDQPHQDLRLMSACQHHVIVNSTFSWWGAWMNPREGKTVVAPKDWFANPKLANPDIIPEGWLRA